MPSPIPLAPEEFRRRPVGVFDSGVGGLTVLHELLVQLPAEDFVYLADSARFPYGERTQAELRTFALEVVEELLARRIKLLVVACGSATAAALPAIRERLMQTTLGVDVLGVVQPGAVQAVAATRNGRVGVLATPATIASGAYAKAIAAADPFVEVTSVACPELAALIEEGFPFDERVVETVRGYCAPLRAAGVDTVVLGCTHYPLVRPMIQRMLGPRVRIMSYGEPLAHQVEHVLGARGLGHPRTDAWDAPGDALHPHPDAPNSQPEAPGSRPDAPGSRADAPGSRADAPRSRPDALGSRPERAAAPPSGQTEGDYSFAVTGDAEAFRTLGTRFLQMPLGRVETVRLAETDAPAYAGSRP